MTDTVRASATALPISSRRLFLAAGSAADRLRHGQERRRSPHRQTPTAGRSRARATGASPRPARADAGGIQGSKRSGGAHGLVGEAWTSVSGP
jgi:hypothetical protein